MTEWVSFEEANKTFDANILQLHGTLRFRSFTRKTATQSALVLHDYTRGDHVLQFEGWHGNGKWGGGKALLSFYNNGLYVANCESILADDYVDWTRKAFSKAFMAEQDVLWQKVFDYVSSL